jgi:hypothetical protein
VEKSVTLVGETVDGSVAKGCLQVCILSPLLWGQVVDELIKELGENCCYTLSYADDIAILISGKFLDTMSEHLQEALNIVQHWCDRTQLSTSSHKIVLNHLPGKETSHITADYGCHIPWTYYGQGIGIEGIAEKCDK